MSLSCMGSSGIRKVFWSLLEVLLHGGRGLCVLAPAILPWKAAMSYMATTLVRLTFVFRSIHLIPFSSIYLNSVDMKSV
jgi:hypothetical protein